MTKPTSDFTRPYRLKLRCFKAHGNWVFAVAFSCDGRHVASGSDTGTVCLWDVASGTAHCQEGHDGHVYGVAFSSNGRHIVSGSQDYTLRLWDVAGILSGPGGRTLRRWEAASISRALEGHDGSVNGVAFSPDSRHVISGSNDSALRLWDVASGVLRVLEGHDRGVLSVAFSPDGRHLVSGSGDCTLRLWDEASGPRTS
jgi:WD40 repeat protein